MTRCWWVDSRKAEAFPVTAACEVAGISTTTFYDWAARGSTGPSDHDLAEAYLVNEMLDIHRGSDGTYGIAADARRAAAPRSGGQPQAGRPIDGRLRHTRGVQGPHGAHHNPRRGQPTDPRSGRSPVRPGLPGRGMGGRHHLHPHRRGLALPRLACWISGHADCWVTRWPTTCAPNWSSTPWTWPSAPEAVTSRG